MLILPVVNFHDNYLSLEDLKLEQVTCVTIPYNSVSHDDLAQVSCPIRLRAKVAERKGSNRHDLHLLRWVDADIYRHAELINGSTSDCQRAGFLPARLVFPFSEFLVWI